MAIVTSSPLSDLSAHEPVSIDLGDGSAGFTWDIPPGSILPPGMQLSQTLGILFGVPTIPGQYHFYVRETNVATGATTQKEFLINVLNQAGVLRTTVEDIVKQALGLNTALPGQAVRYKTGIDIDGKQMIFIEVEKDGQPQVLTSITLN